MSNLFLKIYLQDLMIKPKRILLMFVDLFSKINIRGAFLVTTLSGLGLICSNGFAANSPNLVITPTLTTLEQIRSMPIKCDNAMLCAAAELKNTRQCVNEALLRLSTTLRARQDNLSKEYFKFGKDYIAIKKSIINAKVEKLESLLALSPLERNYDNFYQAVEVVATTVDKSIEDTKDIINQLTELSRIARTRRIS
jgi:predicted DNA-binding protein